MAQRVIFLFFLASLNIFSKSQTDKSFIPQNFLTPRWNNFNEEEVDRRQSLPSFLKKIDSSLLPEIIPSGNLKDLKLSLQRQIDRCKKQDPNKLWFFENKSVSRKVWCIKTSQALLDLAGRSKGAEDLWNKAKKEFLWYKSQGSAGNEKILYTGYFLPTLYGKRSADSINKYPLYMKPKDLVRVKIGNKFLWRKLNLDGSYSRYLTRHDIDWNHDLDNKDLEIVYVDDQVAAFFLHIQGSGMVYLKDRSQRILVNYAAQNGHPYVSIGKILKDEGADEKYYSSLQGLEEYFWGKPTEIDRIFPMNPSYVFFQEAKTGPYGANSTILVPGQTIAIDPSIYPYGALALVKTQKPVVESSQIIGWKEFTSFMTTQDTGGAIKGASRVDIYWGGGKWATLAAGHQNHTGELFFAVHPDLKK